ncbi:MAG TPA: hypothetical protein PKW90_26280 [Myxococcota bacterium]|nr:hypothetical protein [Myxococcota bacterium]
MSHAGSPIVTRLLTHAARVKAVRAERGFGPRGDDFSVEELADLMGVSVDLIYNAVNAGRMEAFRPQGRQVGNPSRRCRAIRSISLRSALSYVLEHTEGMTDDDLTATILRLLSTLGSNAMLTQVARRAVELQARRGGTDNAAVITAMRAHETVPPTPPPHTRHLRVVPRMHEGQPDLFPDLEPAPISTAVA